MKNQNQDMIVTGILWTISIDLDSNVIWDKRLGNTIEDEFFCGDVAPDGSIILAGYSLAYYPNFDVTDTNVGFFEDYWVVKLDSLGNKIWDENMAVLQQILQVL
ncbi:MAG: hypothetical protein IPO27_10160 [Bacteroidetes bacterium]|nr:hypothetical protein [Bacteroidota bacterium]